MLIARLIYILCCIEVVWLNVAYIDYLPILLIPITFLTPIISGLIMLFYKGKVVTTLKANTDIAYIGDKVVIELKVDNKSIFPILNTKYKIRFVNSITAEETIRYVRIPLGAKRSEKIAIDIQMQHCANVITTLEWVKMYDYLNIFVSKKKKKDTVVFSVFPKKEDIEIKEDSIVKSVEGNVYSTTKPGDDVSEIFGIREFTNGDRMQRIHWKLSQKCNKLLVKEYSMPLQDNKILLFEMCEEYREDIEILDSLMAQFLHVSYSMLSMENANYKIGFLDSNTNNIELMKVTTKEELNEAIKSMFSRSKFNSNNELLLSLAENTNRNEPIMVYYFVKENNDNVKRISSVCGITNYITIVEYQNESAKSA